MSKHRDIDKLRLTQRMLKTPEPEYGPAGLIAPKNNTVTPRDHLPFTILNEKNHVIARFEVEGDCDIAADALREAYPDCKFSTGGPNHE